MKTKLIVAALGLLISNGTANSFTERECEKVWSKENWAMGYKKCKEADPQSSCRLFEEPPNYTCVRLTEPFLVDLQRATKAQVVKVMKALGKRDGDEYDTLRFLSIPDGGVVFTFENDRVVHIVAMVDAGQFIWDPADSFACSDLPGSHYPRCNKQ